MFEIGRVVKLNKKEDIAVVEFERKSACDSCHMCAFKKKDMMVKCTLLNTLGAKIGDSVSVKMGDKFVLTASFVVYLVPVLLVLIALASSQKLSMGWQIGLCAIALVAGFGISLLVEKIVKTKKGFKPEMVEIIHTEGSAEESVEYRNS